MFCARPRVGASWRVGWLPSGVITAAGMLLVVAVPLRINRIVPFAALLGPRNALTALAGAGFVVATATLPWRRGRPVLAPLAAGLLILSLISGGVVTSRGFANPGPVPPTAGQLRILSWNTNGDLVAPSAIATLAARLRADIVVLPDANIGRAADSYAAAFRNAAYPMRLDAAPGASAEIAIFVAGRYSDHYGHAVAGPEPGRTLRISSDSAELPAIVGVHAAQPTFHGTQRWNADLSWVADQCRTGQVVAAGDFNATVDSFGSPGLGDCADAATARHAGSIGTWPATVPTWLGMPIDHVLATPGWRPQTFTVVTDQDGSGARHRPIFTVLAR
jgi:endonuclease/exonuclease/phosphatase (EEP) superfamily protein YafD